MTCPCALHDLFSHVTCSSVLVILVLSLYQILTITIAHNPCVVSYRPSFAFVFMLEPFSCLSFSRRPVNFRYIATTTTTTTTNNNNNNNTTQQVPNDANLVR